MVRIVSLSALLALIIILGLTFFQVLAPFLLPLFLAGVFAILCQPLFRYFVDRTGRRVRLASALTSATIVAIILIPLGTLTVLSSLQLYVVATRLNDQAWTKTFRDRTEPLLQYAADVMNTFAIRPAPQTERPDSLDAPAQQDVGGTSVEQQDSTGLTEDRSTALDGGVDETVITPFPETIDPDQGEAARTQAADRDDGGQPPPQFTPEIIRARLKTVARGALQDIGAKSLGTAGRTITGTLDVLSSAFVAVVSAIIGFLVFVIALYFFLADGTALLAETEKLIPVHVAYQRELLNQFARVVRSVVTATFCAGIVQAVATVAALWFFGFEHLLVLLALAILTSMVPLLGTWPIWTPCALWLLWNGHWIQALMLTIYGVAFVGLLDNAVRTYVLNTDAKLHPLLALISVLGGLKAMGLWGVFIGPIVASCLHALVKIFNHELKELSQERFAGMTPAATTAPENGPTGGDPEGRTATTSSETRSLHPLKPRRRR